MPILVRHTTRTCPRPAGLIALSRALAERPLYEDTLDEIRGYARSMNRLDQYEWDPHTVTTARQLVCSVRVLEQTRRNGVKILLEDSRMQTAREDDERKAKDHLVELRDAMSAALIIETNRQVDELRKQVDVLVTRQCPPEETVDSVSDPVV